MVCSCEKQQLPRVKEVPTGPVLLTIHKNRHSGLKIKIYMYKLQMYVLLSRLLIIRSANIVSSLFSSLLSG